jgi:AmmeMemoRadiSam system protein A
LDEGITLEEGSMKVELLLLLALLLAPMRAANCATEENAMLTDDDKQYLLNLARRTVSWYLADRSIPQPAEDALGDNVKKKLGCFVTLNHRKKGLRGCIGIFERERPLYMNVISRAIAAGQDSRFRADPVTPDELKDIGIEISVLTEPEDLPFTSPEDLMSKLRPMVDGVILQTRYGGSTYLPQVWEHFKSKEEFLSHLCRKHGAPMDSWRKDYKNLKVQTYQAIVFGEDGYGRKVVGKKGGVAGKKGATLLGTATESSGIPKGGKQIKEGESLAPGSIVTQDSNVIAKD